MGRALCAAVLLLCAVLAPVSAPAKRAAPFVLLRVEGPPLAHVAAGMSPDEQRRTVARMREAQRPLLAALDSLKVPVVWTYQRVLNGVQVRADVDRAVLRALPGVVQVHPVLLLREVLDYSVPHIGAEQAQLELDVQGTGVAIGIIDAGIDYIHQAFAGPGTKEAYAANDPTTALDYFDGLLLFPTVKVAGGYDFVGDDFDPGEATFPSRTKIPCRPPRRRSRRSHTGSTGPTWPPSPRASTPRSLPPAWRRARSSTP